MTYFLMMKWKGHLSSGATNLRISRRQAWLINAIWTLRQRQRPQAIKINNKISTRAFWFTMWAFFSFLLSRSVSGKNSPRGAGQRQPPSTWRVRAWKRCISPFSRQTQYFSVWWSGQPAARRQPSSRIWRITYLVAILDFLCSPIIFNGEVFSFAIHIMRTLVGIYYAHHVPTSLHT